MSLAGRGLPVVSYRPSSFPTVYVVCPSWMISSIASFLTFLLSRERSLPYDAFSAGQSHDRPYVLFLRNRKHKTLGNSSLSAERAIMTVMTRRRFVLAAAVAGVVVGKGVNERGGTGMQADRALRGLAESQCTAEVTSCDSDAACVTCLSDTDINTSGCMEQYPVSEANVSSYCHSLASSICCAAFEKVAADDTGTAECLENELALEYWVRSPCFSSQYASLEVETPLSIKLLRSIPQWKWLLGTSDVMWLM